MTDKTITLPELSLVILVGTSGSGKSTFARKHFKPTEIISSDYCRALISDNENDQSCTAEAFEVLHYIVGKRLKAGKLTVVDATNVQIEARKSLIQLARKYHVLPVAIVLHVDREICYARNKTRPDRDFGKHVIWNQHNQLLRSLKSLKKKESVTHVHVFKNQEEIESVQITRQPLWTDKKDEQGPFDIIGDIHGCFDELKLLLEKLGYRLTKDLTYSLTHPESRRVIFVGDLVDRGPNSPEVLRLVMDTIVSGQGFCVNGNHDDKLRRKLMGREVTVAHGLQETLDQLACEPEAFHETVKEFLGGLISHYVFDQGKLAVAHAGLKEEFLGRGSPRIREFCMYGETTGEIDSFGLPVRYPWAKDYRGETLIVYGHTPIPESEWINNTINIDTGCVFGGKLTALRYPEKELVSIDAAQVYCEPVKPLDYELQSRKENIVLDIEDVTGKRIINTQLHHHVTIREENTIAALEVMSRFAIDPRWLIYLPPTMSPTETCKEGERLEHPAEAFAFYHKRGVHRLICEEKHMGSRAIMVICKDQRVAQDRFGITAETIGACYTRTGRSFFPTTQTEQDCLDRVQRAITTAGLWETLNTGWICLDAEMLPWSAKAQALLEQQYAAVGAAGEAALPEVQRILELTRDRKVDGIQEICEAFTEKLGMVSAFRQAYRQYSWPVQSMDDYQLAPFHVLAHENSLNMERDHLWHLGVIDRLCEADPTFFRKTPYRIVDTKEEASRQAAIEWWLELTQKGGEGMVVKPLDFTVRSKKGLLQPGVKCRGREYLRIIYGPEYTAPENLERLRPRGLSMKRSLALREYALGYEALSHFVNKAPLYKVHEAVFGVLALESEPVDPRL